MEQEIIITRSDARATGFEPGVGDGAPAGQRFLRDPVWIVGFALFFALGLVWSIGSPLFSVPDEPSHVVKAASVVRGELVPEKQQLPDEGRGFLRGGWTTVVHVPLSYTWNTSSIPGCLMFDTRIPAGCSPGFIDDPRPATWTNLNGRYPPTFYGLVGWPTLFDTGTTGIYLMRFINVAVCAALLATALACAREARRFRLAALGVALAATPQVFFLAGSVNPNGLEIAAAICLWTVLSVVALDDRPRVPTHLLWVLGISAGLLAWTRPLSTLWLAIAFGTVLLFAAGRARVTEVLRSRAACVTAAIVGVLCVTSATWTLVFDALGNNSGDDPRGLGLLDAFSHSLGRSGEYLEQMVGVFGWRSTTMPAPLYWVWGAMVLTLVVLAVRYAPRRLGIGVLVLLGLMVLAPSLLQAPTAKEFGFVWSGRYGLPLGVGLPILAALAVGASTRLRPRGTARLAALVVTVVAVVQVIAHIVSTRRYVVGTDGPLFYLDQHGWDPPLPPWFLLIATIGVAGALALLTYRVATADAPFGRWWQAPIPPATERPSSPTIAEVATV